MTDILKKQSLKKFTFRGKNLEDLLALTKPDSEQIISKELLNLFEARIKRRIQRGLSSHKFKKFIERVRKSKKNAKPGEKPTVVKTHYRNMIVLPEMVGSVIGVYNGKEFVSVEIKFDMIGKYLGEFSMTYKPTRHGRPGVGATKGSQHVDKK